VRTFHQVVDQVWTNGRSSLNVHSVHGPVRNPIDMIEKRSAGGSSGGSAAAVAAGMCDACVPPQIPRNIFISLILALWARIQEVLFVYPLPTVGWSG